MNPIMPLSSLFIYSDRYDEGTVLLPVVEKKSMLPKSDKWEFMALDEDGYDLPSDWYVHF